MLMNRENKRTKGFTLAELLIVVAIIAVLVAVAIPVFTAQLNKAKYATDEANARSIYAELTADYLANGEQTYSVDTDLVEEGEKTTVTIEKEDGTTSAYLFNGMAEISINVADDEGNAPYVIIAECNYNDGPVNFGAEP